MIAIDALNSIPDPLQFLKAFAVHAPVGIQIYSAEGYSLYVNEKFVSFFGCPPPPTYCVLNDEIAAKQGILYLIHKAFSGVPAQLPVSWYDPRELEQLNDEYTKQNGKRCAIETHMSPIFDPQGKVTHVLFIFKDVTAELYMKADNVKVVKERDDANSLIQSLIDHTPAVIYIKDLTGKFFFVNKQFCLIFDKTLADVLGKTNHELFPMETADEFRRNDLKVQETRSYSEVEEVVVQADGKEHQYLSLKFPLLDSAGALFGICGISTDITLRRKLERELNVAKRMESMGLLAGSIAHDFGNILGIVVLHAELLLRLYAGKLPEIEPSLEVIKVQALKASALIRHLLAFGRKNQPETRVIDISAIIQRMKAVLIGAMGEDVTIEFQLDTPSWIAVADPIHIEQILTNLCLNARDAMPKGGVLRITTAQVVLNDSSMGWRIHQPCGEYLELTVSDTGTGMSAEVLNQLFEPFFTTKAEGRGSGLGLTSVIGLVASNSGDIRVESKPGQGSTFRVCFPRGGSNDKAAPPEPVESPQSPTIKSGNETILLVEDEETLRKSMAKILRLASYTVVEAGDGIEGLEIMKKGEHSFDLIATDIIMPRLGGADMIRQMGTLAAFKACKVLFISGYSDERLLAQNLKLDAINFLQKPCSVDALLNKIRDILRS